MRKTFTVNMKKNSKFNFAIIIIIATGQLINGIVSYRLSLIMDALYSFSYTGAQLVDSINRKLKQPQIIKKRFNPLR